MLKKISVVLPTLIFELVLLPKQKTKTTTKTLYFNRLRLYAWCEYVLFSRATQRFLGARAKSETETSHPSKKAEVQKLWGEALGKLVSEPAPQLPYPTGLGLAPCSRHCDLPQESQHQTWVAVGAVSTFITVAPRYRNRDWSLMVVRNAKTHNKTVPAPTLICTLIR